MESKLLALYQMEKDCRESFVKGLSDNEFENLLIEYKTCIETITELNSMILKIYTYNRDADKLSNKIRWLVNKKAKKEFEDAWNNVCCEVEKRIEELKDSYFWHMVDIEIEAFIAENPYHKKTSNYVRRIALLNLAHNMAADIYPFLE